MPCCQGRINQNGNKSFYSFFLGFFPKFYIILIFFVLYTYIYTQLCFRRGQGTFSNISGAAILEAFSLESNARIGNLSFGHGYTPSMVLGRFWRNENIYLQKISPACFVFQGNDWDTEGTLMPTVEECVEETVCSVDSLSSKVTKALFIIPYRYSVYCILNRGNEL